ncbi:MAG: (2Fe-2S)-binding protein, partial [bacterium]|nr:(2Fe-2S)-binding protein [bacterium]
MNEHKNNNDEAKSAVSRRGFLKGIGGGFLGSAAVGTGLLGEQVQAAISGPPTMSGPQRITLHINGTQRQLEVEPRTTLLEALRDRLQLTGSKEVCDRGQCGACTVLIDGVAVLACMTLAADVGQREVTTVEGLAPDGQMNDLQHAFVAQDALMCGFCTPGFVMAGEALLRTNPAPTADEIRMGVSGNLCRCGTYPKVFEAIEV